MDRNAIAPEFLQRSELRGMNWKVKTLTDELKARTVVHGFVVFCLCFSNIFYMLLWGVDFCEFDLWIRDGI
jgi:hypothetical protein